MSATALVLAMLLGSAHRMVRSQDLECITSPSGGYQSQAGYVFPQYNIKGNAGATKQHDEAACWEFCLTMTGCVSVTYNPVLDINCYLNTVAPDATNSAADGGTVTLSKCGDPGRIAATPASDSGTPATPPVDTTEPTAPPTAPATTTVTPPTTPAADPNSPGLSTADVPLDMCAPTAGQDYTGSDIAVMSTDTGHECAGVCTQIVQCFAVSYLLSKKCYLKSEAAVTGGLTPRATTAESFDVSACRDPTTYTVLDITVATDVSIIQAAYPSFELMTTDATGTDVPSNSTVPGNSTATTPSAATPTTTTPIAKLPEPVAPPPVPMLAPTPGAPLAANPPNTTSAPEAGGSQAVRAAYTLLALALLACVLV